MYTSVSFKDGDKNLGTKKLSTNYTQLKMVGGIGDGTFVIFLFTVLSFLICFLGAKSYHSGYGINTANA